MEEFEIWNGMHCQLLADTTECKQAVYPQWPMMKAGFSWNLHLTARVRRWHERDDGTKDCLSDTLHLPWRTGDTERKPEDFDIRQFTLLCKAGMSQLPLLLILLKKLWPCGRTYGPSDHCLLSETVSRVGGVLWILPWTSFLVLCWHFKAGEKWALVLGDWSPGRPGVLKAGGDKRNQFLYSL